jgi:hypothetical protein
VEYFPVRETAAPKIIVSPSTFENEVEILPNKSASADRKTNEIYTFSTLLSPF